MPATCKQDPGAARTDSQKSLEEHRKRIDEIDQQILDLLNQRALHALDIARRKENGSLPVFAPRREAEVLQRLLESNRGPLPEKSLGHVFTEIISACRALQGPMRVAFLGPEFTFSHQAAQSRFGGSCRFAAQATMLDVFDEVDRGRSQVGVVPVENSSEGGVGAAMDQFMCSDLKVCGEIFLPISHVLMSAGVPMEEVKTVYSHPQALAQTRGWLRRNLPGADLVDAPSTSAAAEKAAAAAGCAAVGALSAARGHGLDVLAADIQDNPRNATRFFILCKHSCPPTGADKTSLLFMTAHRPDSLYEALGRLAGRGINLTRIESRPTKDRPWEYAFFVDLIGHQEDEPVREALAALEREVESLKILGSYPQGEALKFASDGSGN